MTPTILGYTLYFIYVANTGVTNLEIGFYEDIAQCRQAITQIEEKSFAITDRPYSSLESTGLSGILEKSNILICIPHVEFEESEKE